MIDLSLWAQYRWQERKWTTRTAPEVMNQASEWTGEYYRRRRITTSCEREKDPCKQHQRRDKQRTFTTWTVSAATWSGRRRIPALMDLNLFVWGKGFLWEIGVCVRGENGMVRVSNLWERDRVLPSGIIATDVRNIHSNYKIATVLLFPLRYPIYWCEIATTLYFTSNICWMKSKPWWGKSFF